VANGDIISRSVLVLNQTYEPLHICDVKRAMLLLLDQKATMVKKLEDLVVRSVDQAFPVPSVIRIHRYVYLQRWSATLNKSNVFKRDNHTCQYCGIKGVPMTIDHIIPKVYGGQDTWSNLVTACIACNNRKGNRTPEEAGMPLLSKPRKPHRLHTLQKFSESPLEEWRPYLFLG